MVVLLHNIIYALFMLLSPVLVVGSYLEQRRNAKRSSRGNQREYAEKLETFRREVSARHDAELEYQRRAYPELAEIVHRVGEARATDRHDHPEEEEDGGEGDEDAGDRKQAAPPAWITGVLHIPVSAAPLGT